METWSLYEDNGQNLFGVTDGKCVLIEERDGLPNWHGELIDINSIVGAREHRKVATLDGYAVIERAASIGAEACEYLSVLANLLGYEHGQKSARATWASLRERDELVGNETLTRDEARTMAAACAASRIAHRELDPSVRDEYEAAWPGPRA